MEEIIEKVEELFSKIDKIDTEFKEHPLLDNEMKNESYGHEKRKHIIQASSLLGIMLENSFLESNTTFVEFGAGKANLTFWLAHAIKGTNDSKILVVDKASHRHKRDNLIQDREIAERIRADIGDLDLKGLIISENCKNFCGLSKHLCGAATDLALNCMVQGNLGVRKTKNFILAVCCHHRCSWNSFVGKGWFMKNNIDQPMFQVMIKMVSWFVCGSGRSRNNLNMVDGKEDERRKKKEIGWKCKRLIDYARVQFMKENNYDARMVYYAEESVTLENVCLIGTLINKDS